VAVSSSDAASFSVRNDKSSVARLTSSVAVRMPAALPRMTVIVSSKRFIAPSKFFRNSSYSGEKGRSTRCVRSPDANFSRPAAIATTTSFCARPAST
jgi:hypothetical protein